MDKKESAERLVSRFREERIKAGITQTELSRWCDMKQSYIGKIETGGVMPRIDTFAALVDEIGFELVLVKQKPRRKVNNKSNNEGENKNV